jgi:hypothetical protein
VPIPQIFLGPSPTLAPLCCLTPHLTPQDPARPLHPSLLVNMTTTPTHAGHLTLHMPSLPPLTSTSLHHVSCLPLTLLMLLVHAADREDVGIDQERT